jgi:hypothetical protein
MKHKTGKANTVYLYCACVWLIGKLTQPFGFIFMLSKTHLTLFVSVIFVDFYIILSPLTSVASLNMNVTERVTVTKPSCMHTT